VPTPSSHSPPKPQADTPAEPLPDLACDAAQTNGSPTEPQNPESAAHTKALDGQPVTPPMGAGRAKPPAGRKTIVERIEAFLSKLSTRNNFWHRVCSMIWLPYAFRSGIQMKQVDKNTFTAVLPFRRFNKNWYNAMAGAALLGNSEIAGGMYVFAACGGDYTVVCKHLDYKFLRPCFGPAEYKITPRENIEELVAAGTEFNITIDLHIAQKLTKPGGREKRIGKCSATFHVTPKVHNKQKRSRRK
jgi:hypothetical protein